MWCLHRQHFRPASQNVQPQAVNREGTRIDIAARTEEILVSALSSFRTLRVFPSLFFYSAPFYYSTPPIDFCSSTRRVSDELLAVNQFPKETLWLHYYVSPAPCKPLSGGASKPTWRKLWDWTLDESKSTKAPTRAERQRRFSTESKTERKFFLKFDIIIILLYYIIPTSYRITSEEGSSYQWSSLPHRGRGDKSSFLLQHRFN